MAATTAKTRDLNRAVPPGLAIRLLPPAIDRRLLTGQGEISGRTPAWSRALRYNRSPARARRGGLSCEDRIPRDSATAHRPFTLAPTKTSFGRRRWGLDCRRPSFGKDVFS